MKYGKEILALKSLIEVLKKISRECGSEDMEQIITVTEKRLESLEKIRNAELAEQQSKLSKAPEVLKELFRLRYVEELKIKEVAKKMGYSEQNIYVLNKKLKNLLQAD